MGDAHGRAAPVSRFVAYLQNVLGDRFDLRGSPFGAGGRAEEQGEKKCRDPLNPMVPIHDASVD
jgi:hypothetical protein